MNHLQKPGNIVLTLYGVAVIISNQVYTYGDQTILSYKVRLWRQPGKSIASSSVAYLQHDCVSCLKGNYVYFIMS